MWENRETQISLMDFFGRLLIQWKRCVLWSLIIATLAIGINIVRPYLKNDDNNEIFDEQVYLNAKNALTEEELIKADQLYDQYNGFDEFVAQTMRVLNRLDEYDSIEDNSYAIIARVAMLNIGNESNRKQWQSLIDQKIDELTEDQQIYIRQRLLKDHEITVENEKKEKTEVITYLKTAVIGFFVGVFLYILFGGFFPYLFRDIVRTVDETENTWGIRRLQTADQTIGYRIPKWDFLRHCGEQMVRKMDLSAATEEAAMQMAAEEICHRMEKARPDRISSSRVVFVAGDENNANRLIGEIEARINAHTDDSLICTTGSSLQEADSFTRFLGADAVVFFTVIDRTTRTFVRELYRMCKDNEIPILGYVAVRE